MTEKTIVRAARVPAYRLTVRRAGYTPKGTPTHLASRWQAFCAAEAWFRALRSPTERLLAWYVASDHRVIGAHQVATGGSHSVATTPRDILAPALLHGAAGLLLAHNHPSGESTPSDLDIAFTAQLVRAARTVQLTVLDHIVVSQTPDCRPHQSSSIRDTDPTPWLTLTDLPFTTAAAEGSR